MVNSTYWCFVLDNFQQLVNKKQTEFSLNIRENELRYNFLNYSSLVEENKTITTDGVPYFV